MGSISPFQQQHFIKWGWSPFWLLLTPSCFFCLLIIKIDQFDYFYKNLSNWSRFIASLANSSHNVPFLSKDAIDHSNFGRHFEVWSAKWKLNMKYYWQLLRQFCSLKHTFAINISLYLYQYIYCIFFVYSSISNIVCMYIAHLH